MLTLVLGGAASGKSEYAESLVLRTTGPRWYLATMQIWDAECAARVEKHRKMRAAKQFETVECPLHLEKLRLPARGTVLLEDLGNLAANELYDPAGEPGNAAKALLQVGIGGDVVAHLAIVELLIGHHVKVAGAGQAKDDGLFLAGLLALEGLVDGGADGVAALGGGQDALSLVWLDFITSLS